MQSASSRIPQKTQGAQRTGPLTYLAVRMLSMKPIMKKIATPSKFGTIREQGSPEVVASLNGQELTLVKFCETLPKHFQKDRDELFMV